MLTGMIERLAGALRPVQMRGKGLALNAFTPHDGLRTVPVWGDAQMTLDLANAIHRQIFMGCFAREMTVWTQKLLPEGGAFLDVGAHIGYFTLLAAQRVGSGGQVFAVEPNPRAFSALQSHLEAAGAGNVRAEQIALSDQRGNLRLFGPPLAEARDYNVTMMPRPGWDVMDVPCVPLDERFEAWGVERIDVMKIDVEGAEPRVLAGGTDGLRKGIVRHLAIEVNGPRLVEGGSSPAALVDQLKELGFSPANLRGGRAIPVPLSTIDLDPTHEHDRLFVHRMA